MYDAAVRVRLVKSRVRRRRRERERRALRGLAALCLLLAVSLCGTAGAAGFGSLGAMGLYGSILLHEGASGYVVVGVLSFTAAVVITVLCIRYRKKCAKKEEKE